MGTNAERSAKPANDVCERIDPGVAVPTPEDQRDAEQHELEEEVRFRERVE
jgi:hypothetical protein